MWVDLTQTFHGDVPHSAALPQAELERIRTIDEHGANAQWYGAATHVGTHVDAPRHFVPDGATIDELPLDRFAGEAVVLDVSCEEPETIPVRAIDGAEREAGADVGEGDMVLFHTGWARKYDDPSYHRYPWLADEVGDWLLERGVTLVGVDTPSPDRPREMRPEGWSAYPIHRTLLPEGVLIIEHLANLDAVAGSRIELFAFPVKILAGDGAPARVVARV